MCCITSSLFIYLFTQVISTTPEEITTLTTIIVVLSVLIVIILLASVLGIGFLLRRKRTKRKPEINVMFTDTMTTTKRTDLTIDPQDIEIKEKLGEGRFSEVYSITVTFV